MKMIDKMYRIKLGIIKPKNNFEKNIVKIYEVLFGFSASKYFKYIGELYMNGLELKE